MPSRSPHGRISPSISTHTATPVKSEPGEDGKGKPKNFVCDKCGKRYARRDYLERHALNHEARSYKCNACGKGFARIDVLKKHEAVACKMLRPYGQPDIPNNAVASSSRPVSSHGPSRHQGYGQASASASTSASTTTGGRHRIKASRTNSPVATYANANASVGAGRKRQKREESVESSVSSSEEDELEPDTPYDRRFSTDTIHQAGHQYPPQPPPHHPPPPPPGAGAGYEYHQDIHTQQQHYHHHQRTQAVSDTRMNPSSHLPPIHTHSTSNGTYPLISPVEKDMSMSLAPAYAPTPDVSDLPVDPAPIRINTDIHSMPVMDHGMVDQHQPLSAHAHAHAHDHVHTHIQSGNASTDWDSVGGGGHGSDFGMPAKAGENMDDLLGWLFNTNAPGTGGDWSFGIQQGQIQQDMHGQQFLPTFSNNPPSGQTAMPTSALNYSPVDPHDTSQEYPPPSASHYQTQAQIPEWIPPSDPHQEVYHEDEGPSERERGSTMRTSITDDQHRYSQSSSSTTHRRYPQAFHPLYVPHIPGKTSIPNFSGSEKILIQGREKYKEVIDEEVHEAMLDMFEGPGKRELMSPAFSIQRMRLYLELYFMHFAPLYPIIHQPSLRFRRLPPDLLLALICIGTAFAEDKEGLRIASKIHKRLRNRIFEMVEDEPKASVHNLQTLLLINHFSRSYCSLKEHDISQIFHSPSVYMIRLAGTLLPKFNRQNTVSDDPVTCWLDWVCEEERKRLGWFAFMMDLENAALYRHFLMIHCYFMEIPFPTSSSSWTARDPFSWSTALRESLSIPTPSFRNALRELAGRGQVPANLNDQSLWILIHGLINVSWTLLWRDLGELSMVHENKITGWKDSLRRAFKTWVGHVEGRAAVCEESLYTVGIPFAQLGSILLLSDTEEIRIFAGAANIAGRSISPGEWTAANTYVHAWARSQDGAYACYTAIELLAQVYKWSAEDRWATAPAFIPWCTYVSSLIIWAYSTVLDGPDSLQAPYIIPMTNNADKPLEHGQTSEIRIEPSLARRAAQSYISTMLRQTQGEAFALPDVQGKNACAGVLAYTAYLMGIGGRGVLDEARRVLLGLLGEG